MVSTFVFEHDTLFWLIHGLCLSWLIEVPCLHTFTKVNGYYVLLMVFRLTSQSGDLGLPGL